MPVAMVAESGREFLPVIEYVDQLQAYVRDTYQAVKRLQAAAHERVKGDPFGSPVSRAPRRRCRPRQAASFWE